MNTEQKTLKAGDHQQSFDGIASDIQEVGDSYITAMINGPGNEREPPAIFIEVGTSYSWGDSTECIAIDYSTLTNFIQHLTTLQAHLALHMTGLV